MTAEIDGMTSRRVTDQVVDARQFCSVLELAGIGAGTALNNGCAFEALI